MNLTKEARDFLRGCNRGVLSTHSAKYEGYPFGSVTPFVLDHDANPVILISTLAEHTKNILQNPKVSLIVLSDEDDMLANARLTMIGTATRIDKENPHLKARYLRYLPQASSYFDMHDFYFYQVNIEHARYIAGFGKMSWIDGGSLAQSPLPQASYRLPEQETDIVDHMNHDHADNLIAYCKHQYQVEAISAKMLGIDQDGFDVLATLPNDQTIRLRFGFTTPVMDANEARVQLVAMAKAART